MKILGMLHARDIEGADHVLDGFMGECASGNQVRIWPAMTYDPDAAQTRVAFFTEWRRAPTPNDTGELLALTSRMAGGPPALMTETTSDPRREPENIDWLRSGKRPKPPRTH